MQRLAASTRPKTRWTRLWLSRKSRETPIWQPNSERTKPDTRPTSRSESPRTRRHFSPVKVSAWCRDLANLHGPFVHQPSGCVEFYSRLSGSISCTPGAGATILRRPPLSRTSRFSSTHRSPSNAQRYGAMRRLILLGLMAAVVLPAFAAKRVTVAQLEQSLAADSASHRADADIAHRLSDLELSERLTGATLDRFANKLPLGPRTALALQLLSDQSAFLDPPATELPATGMPDAAAQQRMMELARGYWVGIWPHLPNFFVTRATARFDDSPQVFKQGEWPVRAGLHLVGTGTSNLTYRDGKDIIDQS